MQQENQVVTGPPKVMIVEDEAIIARDIQLRLGRFGFAVTGTAPSAAKAFQSIEEDRPDIVLMDIRLRGEMDGVEAANVMRNRYRLPVIFLTAHADDATLRRAQMTEPFGYIVKPLGKTDMKAMLMMACHKHQMQQAAERHRAIFFRGLQDLPDAVLLADELHNVLFLNRAGEEMTGRGRQDAIGKGLPAVISLVDKAGNAVSMSLLQQTAVFGQPVRLPRGTTLIRADGERLDVTGQLTVSRNPNEPAFLFLMLQDVGVQQSDLLRLRQERQTIVAGELAHGVAREFFALFDLVQNTAEALREKPMDDSYRCEVDLMRTAGEIGAKMSTQLSGLGMGHGGSHLVDVNEYLFAAQAIIEPLCGSGIALSISSSPDVGYVLNTGHYVAQMLFHLALEGKQRLDGHGTLSITADTQTRSFPSSQPASYVRISLRAERSPIARDASAYPFPFGAEPPELGLSIVRAMALASEGFTHVFAPTESVSVIEVFLPRHETDCGEPIRFPPIVQNNSVLS